MFGTESYKVANVADGGDVAINPINLLGLMLIEAGIADIVAKRVLRCRWVVII